MENAVVIDIEEEQTLNSVVIVGSDEDDIEINQATTNEEIIHVPANEGHSSYLL